MEAGFDLPSLGAHGIGKGIMESEGNAVEGYWKANLRLLAILLSIWFLVSFGAGILFVDALNSIRFFGFKLGFFFAQQGAIYVFIVLIFVYVWIMGRIERAHDVDEE